MFHLIAPFSPAGDQPKAIAQLTEGLHGGLPHQVLLGVTGSGKTFTIANVIERLQRPTLVLSHNKTLAAQLFQEFKAFFPHNAVHYFVSYYDYYQPEAYIPQSDTYIEKDVKINEELDRMRHAATQAVLMRNDVIVVASVSAIYNIGSPKEYRGLALAIAKGQRLSQRELLEHLVSLQYSRNDVDLVPGTFRVRGGSVAVAPPSGDEALMIEFGSSVQTVKNVRVVGNENQNRAKRTNNLNKRSDRTIITALTRRKGLGIADPEEPIEQALVFPAKFWVTPQKKINLALANIEAELAERLRQLKVIGKLLEAQRLSGKTRNDLAMMRELGYCHGIENYSRHLEFREPDEPPFTLLDYFDAAYGGKKRGSFAGAQDNFSTASKNWLTVIDESHMTIPQLRGMWLGDKARKTVLIEHGFRLPSAIDNRPLKFGEVTKKLGRVIYMSATPGMYELGKAQSAYREASKTKRFALNATRYAIVEQLVRPTGLIDPSIEVRGTREQVPYLIAEMRKRIEKQQRILVLTLTKRLAEDLAEYLAEQGIRVHYLHAEVKTMERPDRIRDLRLGEIDAIVGINLLREGIDIPEVALVAILDADKEGFLRNETTLIQMIGRAARHKEGHAILFADRITHSMRRAIAETNRRRRIQRAFNLAHGIIPATIDKPVEQSPFAQERPDAQEDRPEKTDPRLAQRLRKEMRHYAKNLEFEKASRVRDLLRKLTGL